MKFVYPAKSALTDFQSIEFKGMQALAVGNQKEAAACYDKAILTDPSLKTTHRVVKQYKKAGYKGSPDCIRYFYLSTYCDDLNSGREEYGNFHLGLKQMRKKHRKFVEELQQQAVTKAEAQGNQQGCSSRVRPPSYDESMTQQTALLQGSKPN